MTRIYTGILVLLMLLPAIAVAPQPSDEKESIQNPSVQCLDSETVSDVYEDNDLRLYLETIEDGPYKTSITGNEDALEALSFFHENDHADILLSKKISAGSIIKLYDILKSEPADVIEDYINNATGSENDNSIALILQSNLLDWDVAMSAYICRTFNIPYIIVSNRDGDFINPSGNLLKLSLERADNAKKLTCPMNSLLAPTYGELDFARNQGDTYRVKTDLSKQEILDLLESLAGEYGTLYFFINTHARDRLVIYSAGRLSYISASEIFERIKKAGRPLNFKIISGHCYDIFEKELEKKVKDIENLEYSFLTSSSVKAWEGDLLESLIYANDGIITADELKEICSGRGHVHTTVSQEGESFYIYKKQGPPYMMDICYAGRGYCDYELRTNTDDMSIFYYRIDYY